MATPEEPLAGVRVLEVAQFTFVPSAGAVLADWGADVIKVEHAVQGDAQRGLRMGETTAIAGSFTPIMEHANRGKRSIGLALEDAAAVDALYRIAATCDVFLTNFLPDACRRLHIEVDDLRAASPEIIYARGSAFGPHGPEATRGGYDATAYWARGGSAFGITMPGADPVTSQPAPAYGDTIGGMTIAAGIAAALFKRAATGVASTVDVSLLGVGAYANALAVDIALLTGEPWDPTRMGVGGRVSNPLGGTMPTKDGRFITLSMLQAGRYWTDFTERIGMPELATDPRFDTAEKLFENAPEGAAIVRAAVASMTLDECRQRFLPMEGQWAVVQDSLEVGHDTQVRANGQIGAVTDADGVARELVVNPVLFDGAPPCIARGPQFAEHTDAVLEEAGYSEDEILKLKVAGAAT
jgi:crotonobetainyl-CoA:carnitine CoA-transferase CaiB-like acyl-CoA transferase